MTKKRERMSFEKSGRDNKNVFRIGMWVLIAIVGASIVIGVLISFTTVVAVKETSGVNFCGACHSMKPMADSYRKSVHGGYGKSGVVALCADCHLPHESTLGYLIQKVKTGVHDVLVESSGEAHKIDWHEKREHRREWAYDSACLHCHKNLLKGTQPSKKAFTAHKAYFAKKLFIDSENGKEPAQCVDCHKYVGHYELVKYLPEPYAADTTTKEAVKHENEK